MVKLHDVIDTGRESFRIIEFLEEPNTGLANVECIRGGEVFQVRTVPVSLLEAVGTAVGNVPFPFCEECDHQIERVDEDGCCLTCGNDAIHPTAAHVRDAIHGRSRVLREVSLLLGHPDSLGETVLDVIRDAVATEEERDRARRALDWLASKRRVNFFEDGGGWSYQRDTGERAVVARGDTPLGALEAAMGLPLRPTDADAERGRILDVIRSHLSALPQGDPGRAALADLATELVLPKREASDG